VAFSFTSATKPLETSRLFISAEYFRLTIIKHNLLLLPCPKSIAKFLCNSIARVLWRVFLTSGIQDTTHWTISFRSGSLAIDTTELEGQYGWSVPGG